MPKNFEFKSDLDKLKQFYRSAPKMLERAGVNLSNDIAFTLRSEMLEQIESSMTIRSPGFVRGSLKIKKANFRDKVAEVGSIRRDRFTGWEEQETGKPDERDRRQTLAARRSNWKNRVAPRVRLKPGKQRFIRPSDVKLTDTNQQDMRTFLQILDRTKHRAPFYIPARYKKLKRGIYIFKAKKIKAVQVLDAKPKNTKINSWAERSLGVVTQTVVEKKWKKAMDFQLRRKKY